MMKLSIFGLFMSALFVSTGFAAPDSQAIFPKLTGTLKVQADQIERVDYNLTKAPVTSENADVLITNILKAIDSQDTNFFHVIKQNDVFDISGLTCLVDIVKDMAPEDKSVLKKALKRVVPLLGYGAYTVDLLIS